MHEPDNKIKQSIENCYLRPLSKNYDENEFHEEYVLRKNNLDTNILTLRENLGNLTTAHEIDGDTISMLLILFKELQTKGEWNTENSLHYAIFLNSDFERLYDISLQNLLEQEPEACQLVFELSLQKLHNKLTRKDFKKYPSLIQVYELLLKDLKVCGVLITY